MNRITDRALVELLAKADGGKWAVGSTENIEFHIYDKASDPIKYILSAIPEDTSNYNIRLMSLARELAEEVLEYRIKQRRITDAGS